MRTHLPYSQVQLTAIIDETSCNVAAIAELLGTSQSKAINVIARCGRWDQIDWTRVQSRPQV